MKIIKLLLVFILTYTNHLLAQDKGYIAISFGYSAPVGDYASTDSYNSSAGFAKGGAFFDISAAYKLGEYFGVAGLMRGQANPTDAQAIADQLSYLYPSIFGIVETTPWGIGSYLAGGYGSFAITEKTLFDSRALFGISRVTCPEILITDLGFSNSLTIKSESAVATSFAFLLGAGFRFNVGKRICLLTSVDYINTKPKFKNVETSSSIGINSYDTFSQSISTFDFGFGIGYRL